MPAAKKRPTGPGRNGKNAGFIALLLLFALILFAVYRQPSSLDTIPITQAVQQSNAGDFSKIDVSSNQLLITKKGQDHPTVRSYIEPNATLKDTGFDYSKVEITSAPANSGTPMWLSIGNLLIPILIFGALIFFLMRSVQGQGNQAMSFGKSRARLYGDEKDKITFKDVAGSAESK